MMYAKCIRMSDTYCLIRDSNGKELDLPMCLLEEATKGDELHIINLDDNLEIDAKKCLEGYKLLKPDSISKNVYSAYYKSVVLGVAPKIREGCGNEQDMMGNPLVVEEGAYEDIYITDCNRAIDSGTVRARTITFIGDMPLIGLGITSEILCNRAIIMNKCILTSIYESLDTDNKSVTVGISASIIELKHKYIDENTVFEVQRLLKMSRGKYMVNNVITRLHLIKIHFEDQHIIELAKRNVESTVQSIIAHKKSTKTALGVKMDKRRYNVLIATDVNNWCADILYLISMMISIPEMRSYILKQLLWITKLFEHLPDYRKNNIKNKDDREHDNLLFERVSVIITETLILYKKYKEDDQFSEV